MIRSRRALWGKGLVSAGFFLVLFRVVGGADVADLARTVDARWVAASIGMSFALIGASCWKWWLLLRHQRQPVPFVHLLRLYFVGYFFTCLLPSNVGGDVARSYYAGRSIGSQQHAAVSVLLERFTGLVLLLLLAAVCPWTVPGAMGHPAFALPAAGAAVLLLFMAWAARRRRPVGRAADWLRRLRSRSFPPPIQGAVISVQAGLDRLRDRVKGFQEKLTTAVSAFRRDPGLFGMVLALTIAFYALACVNVYVSFRAFHTPIEFRTVVGVLPTALVIAMLPVAPLAGLGLAEGAYVFYFGFAGVAPSASLAMGLLLRGKLLLLGAIGWALHLTLPPISRLAGPGEASEG